MPSLLEVARHEAARLRSICRKLSELNLPDIKDEVDQLQLTLKRMERKLEKTDAQVGRNSGAA